LLTLLGAFLALAAFMAFAPSALAQPHDPEPDEPTGPGQGRNPNTANFGGSVQVVHGPSGSTQKGPGIEIFPDASRVWMSVRGDADAVPIEKARRGGSWACKDGSPCRAEGEPAGQGDDHGMLQSIKVQSATLPLPVTIWGRNSPTDTGQLYFNPTLLETKSYDGIDAYPPVVRDTPAPTMPDEGQPTNARPSPDDVRPLQDKVSEGGMMAGAVDLILSFRWPSESEFADFRYIAIVDTCGNAWVLRYQRSFTIPTKLMRSGGCDAPDGKVLRVFPQGGFVRVTAFNLDAPAIGDVMSVTYRVEVPALDNSEAATPAKYLLPDLMANSLSVDCSPRKQDSSGPAVPPGMPPGIPPGAKPGDPKAPPGAPGAPPPAPPPPPKSTAMPLNNGSVVISPEPLKLGNCRINLKYQSVGRLVAPLMFHVSLVRTDADADGNGDLQDDWVVTHTSLEYSIPHLVNGNGEARLKLIVSTEPLNPRGGAILLSDAPRIAGFQGSANDDQMITATRRPLGSLTIHSVPLCGGYNFETVESTGSCLRGYLTVPAMLGTFQITRAPWIEKPLITRKVLSAVGVAFAFDSYDPVERRAFPIAGQVGGFVEDLDEDHTGLMAYAGVAPTLPVLGDGGSTTTLGFLGGIGIMYIINSGGPDEGLKPTAFVSFVVQVGQANPTVSGQRSFGEFQASGSIGN